MNLDSEESSDDDLVENLAEQFLYGDHSVRPQAQARVRTKDWPTALEFLSSQKEHLLDLCELCGGYEARTSQIAIRRRLKAGHHFGLVCDVDLGDPHTQVEVLRYINDSNILIVIMAPSCRAIGPPSNLNFSLNPEGWGQSSLSRRTNLTWNFAQSLR